MTEKELSKCFNLIARTVIATSAKLNHRERLALQAGLSAAHAEEALVKGDVARAQAHFDKLMKLAKELG